MATTVRAGEDARQRLALVMTVALVGSVVAMLALHWLDRSVEVDTWILGNVVIGAAIGGLGALLVRRVQANPIGWLMLATGLSQALLGAGREWAVYATLGPAAPLPGAAWAAWFGTWPSTFAVGTLPLVLILFPDGRPPSRRWRPVVWAIAIVIGVGTLADAFTPGSPTDQLPGAANPVGVASDLPSAIASITQLLLMASMVPAIVAVVVRTVGSSGVLRQQMKWIAFAGSLLGLELLLELAPLPADVAFLGWLGPLLVAFFVASIVIAILRYRLWDIDALISYSLLYGTLTLLLGGIYVGLVAVSGRLRDHPVAVGSSLVAAAVVAVAFAPLRDRLQRAIDRRIYGDRRDPYLVLTRLGSRLRAPEGDDDMVLDEVVDSIAASLRFDLVAITTPDGEVVATTGTARTAPAPIPLTFRSEPVGSLVVATRPGVAMGRRERAALSSLAPTVAAVVHAVAARQDLQHSRLELVTAREEERRRLRRDLHDGFGPALAAVRMQLEATATLIDRRPEEAKAVLDRLTTAMESTITEVRRLVYELQPVALDELGLVDALHERSSAFSGPTEQGGYLDVELSAPTDLGGLPAAVEVAVYRIVSEALHNVRRHARASRCRVTLERGPGEAICVTVDDDGDGLPTESRRGVGVGSMIERATELGGSARLDRSPLGGTRVAARIPVGLPGGSDDRATPPDAPS